MEVTVGLVLLVIAIILFALAAFDVKGGTAQHRRGGAVLLGSEHPVLMNTDYLNALTTIVTVCAIVLAVCAVVLLWVAVR